MLFNIFSFAAFAQELNYVIEWRGDSIGYMIATKSLDGEVEVYSMQSEASISILLSFDLRTEYEAKYADGVLTTANTHNILNDKTRSKSNIKKSDSGYVTVVNEEKSYIDDTAIGASISTLYFKEPQPGKIFSERYGQWCKLAKSGGFEYELYKPDGRKNYYRYKNGECVEIEVHTALATITMKRVN